MKEKDRKIKDVELVDECEHMKKFKKKMSGLIVKDLGNLYEVIGSNFIAVNIQKIIIII